MVSKKKQVNPSELSLTDQISYFLLEAEKIAERAKRGKKSLKGNTPNAERFYDCRTQATRALKEIQTAISPIANPGLERTFVDTEKELSYFFDLKTSIADRRDLRRHIEMLVKAEIEPAHKTLSRIETEFIPIEIVDGSRGYVVNVARQANRCFQCDALDACGVMVRRLLETLIIEVFEKKGIGDKIKDGSGNFIMFTDLVNKLINAAETPVGRTTKKELPTIAIVLNNCAHSRTFNISKTQLVQYKAIIVIAVQELMGLWDVYKPHP
jgi:hypothetical protein